MINILDKNTINQIAAGEVIERPASVVKELVENSLDAGAANITVEIKNGGLTLIRITDNGSGILRDDIKKAFLSHATSKIKSAEDLTSVKSLGFRGEALPSIMSIARVEVLTKTSDDFLGTRYQIEGGEEKAFEEAGCPVGTTILVKDIFFNTPVRRKFLKSPTTEAGYITEIVEKLALSHTDISFKLISNNKVILHTTGSGKLSNLFLEIYGLDIAKALIDIRESDLGNKIIVTGVVAKPYISRSTRDYEAFFVNGRSVKCKILQNALEDAFKGYMMGHSFPVAAIYLEMPLDMVDVNVHPSKLELRFSDNDLVYKTIYDAVRNALTGKNMIVTGVLKDNADIKKEKEEKKEMLNSVHIPEPFEQEVLRDVMPIIAGSPDYNGSKKENTLSKTTAEMYVTANKEEYKEELKEKNKTGIEQEINQETDIESKDKFVNNPKINREINLKINQEINPEIEKCIDNEIDKKDIFAAQFSVQEELPLDLYKAEKTPAAKDNFKLIGQVFKTYWIIEMGNTMFMIDQHAAHEKVLFEKTMKRFREKKETLTQSIMPQIISLSERAAEVLQKNIREFVNFGFDIEEFGPKEFKISGVPADLVNVNPDEVFNEILACLMAERSAMSPETIIDRIATISCKAAVKGNNTLSFAEAEKLIAEMLTLENPYHCPHGRPTTISMTKDELEKKFKRVL